MDDTELIEFCKENNYIHIDYSPKLTEYTQKSVDCLNDLFKIKLKDEKYDKCIFSINSEKIHKKIKFQIYEFFKLLEVFPFEHTHTIYINKNKKMNISNKLNVSKRMLRKLLKMDETSCVICLEKVSNIGKYTSCSKCSAIYHTDCIHNDNYSYCDELHLYCCVGKEAIGWSIIL